jgi:hypothetical protein
MVMRINGTSYLSSIKLGDNDLVPKEVQVLRVGKFNHPRYGAFEITRQTLNEMKLNFDNKVRGIDMAFDYFHESDKEASGWVKDLVLKENGQELWADVEWTPKAQAKLAERELRYFSPDFTFEWTDPEKGVTFNNVLFGGGLTNRPFVKEMKAIVANETKGDNMTELEKAQKEISDLKAQNVKLSEQNQQMEQKMADMPPAGAPDKVKELESKIAAMQQELAAEKAKGAQLEEEKKKADADKLMAEKEKDFNVLLSEGKAVAAQKDAFLKGNMAEFIKNAGAVNLGGMGSSESAVTLTEDNQKILKLAEEKMKADPKLQKGDAISMARKELKLNK